jgi:hypothetical protein
LFMSLFFQNTTTHVFLCESQLTKDRRKKTSRFPLFFQLFVLKIFIFHIAQIFFLRIFILFFISGVKKYVCRK